MKRYFKTVDQQIDILKSRGLIIKDENLAKEILLHYNYYKVINGTIMFFNRKDDPYKYLDNTTFEEIEATHVFDKEIKKIFLNSILDIERHLRSIVAYTFMEHHPEANSYLNPDNFNNDKSLIDANIYSMSKTIDNFEEEVNYNKSIKYYYKKYNHVPLWFLINFISFGKLVNFYETMKDNEAYEVANDFTKFLTDNIPEAKGYYLTQRQFESVIKNIKEIRNVCAHDNLILSYKCEDDIVDIAPIHDKYGIEKNDDKKDLFNVYIVMQILLTKDQFRDLSNLIRAQIEELRKLINKKAFDKVMESIGFMDIF
ncbi:MAG: Abi family protein [Tissierellia bacterium]|nr:Abi family protein [Tissierellia bacterium]